jgi:hypothetical protein
VSSSLSPSPSLIPYIDLQLSILAETRQLKGSALVSSCKGVIARDRANSGKTGLFQLRESRMADRRPRLTRDRFSSKRPARLVRSLKPAQIAPCAKLGLLKKN